jgi:hypothetical protein
LDDHRRQLVLRVCDYYRRGIFTAEEACIQIVLSCLEPPHVAEQLELLPEDLQATLVNVLPTLPVSDDEWAEFRGVCQLDGNEWSWAQMVIECRNRTEAARAYLFGVSNPPAEADFVDRVRRVYRERLDKYRR